MAAAATLGIAGPARAALYTGNWDPAYGTIFPQLGWEASAVFNVPEACLAGPGGSDIPLTGACSGFDILSAQVSFYNVAHPDVVLATYALDVEHAVVNGIGIAHGALTGVETGFFAPFASQLSIAGGGAYGFSLFLYDDNLAQLVYATPPSQSPTCAFPVPPSTTHSPGCGLSANPAVGVFAPVPEPETYALMLAGLAAMGVVARRRRQRG